jgi:hypothetical protein
MGKSGESEMDHSSLNNSSLLSADGATHVKIVAVALVAGMMVIGVGIAARSNLDLGTDVGGNPRLEAKGPVIKATKPTAFSGGETITVR